MIAVGCRTTKMFLDGTDAPRHWGGGSGLYLLHAIMEGEYFLYIARIHLTNLDRHSQPDTFVVEDIQALKVSAIREELNQYWYR